VASSRTSAKLLTVLKLVGVLVLTGVLAAGIFLPYVGGAGFAASKASDKFLNESCDIDTLTNKVTLAQTTSIYARDNKTLIAKLYTDNRQIIPLAQVPKIMQQALIDTEDRRFYDHHGVDTRGLLRAVVNESNGGDTQGGSTLTQQYVKQVRFYQATTDAERAAAIAQTGDRKLYEAKCALDLEKIWKKSQILGAYFNIAYFGEQSYGIQVAARNYFNVNAAQLTVPQAAMLAGLVKDPSLYDPFQNPKAAKERRDEVIDNMVKAGDLTSAQGAKYKQAPLVPAGSTAPQPKQGCQFANDISIKNVGFFCDYVVNWLATKGGISTEKLSSGGYRVVTTIDPNLQNQGQAAMESTFPSSTSSDSAIMPEVDPKTGQVLAMVTSLKYNYANAHANDPKYTSIPVFTKPTAGSGSTFKYFTTVAMLTAGATAQTSLTTAGAYPAPYKPKNCPQDQTDPNNWIRNAGNYRATLSLRDAFVQSSNTYFVGAEDQVFGCNLDTIVDAARNMGLTTSLDAPDPNNPKITIGQGVKENSSYTFTLGQTSVSPLELASAYSASANDGLWNEPRPVLSIIAPGGKAVAFKKPINNRYVMSPWVARTITNMLTGDTTGAGTAGSEFGGFYGTLGFNGHLVAGKTGTNNASVQTGPQAGQDAGTNAALWFVGMTPYVVSATAVYNIKCPTCQIDIPGQSATGTFGAYSAAIWVAALQPYLSDKNWVWPDPAQIPNATQVQTFNIIGQPENQAIDSIKAQGFKPVRYPIDCGGPSIPGNVNFVGPGYAIAGQNVYYCLSNGKPLTTAPKPTPTKTTKPGGGTAGGADGTGNGGGNNGGGNTARPPRR
jgi:membrane peptidoglycan carboxypeptidase